MLELLDSILLYFGLHAVIHRYGGVHIFMRRNYKVVSAAVIYNLLISYLICSQKHIDFDSIYGWEVSLQDPVNFWKHVPPRWKPLYHFFNSPLSSSADAADSVQSFLTKLQVTPNDFVSFKLDIDTPAVEIPIALELLNPESAFAGLVDEFFFELHFRCEIMMHCGWGHKVPREFAGLKLDRYGALKFFSDIRRKGIRAHFWP